MTSRQGIVALCALLAPAAWSAAALDAARDAGRRVDALEGRAEPPVRPLPVWDGTEASLVPALRTDVEEALAAGLHDLRVRRVVGAMALLAEGEPPGDLRTLLRRWGTDPSSLAEVIVMAADRWEIDPLVVTAMAWRESRFRPGALGDHRDGAPRSCGITQIRTDFPGRPTCERLMDVNFALLWTTERLAASRDAQGRVALSAWNGGGYETDVWRDVDWIRSRLQE